MYHNLYKSHIIACKNLDHYVSNVYDMSLLISFENNQVYGSQSKYAWNIYIDDLALILYENVVGIRLIITNCLIIIVTCNASAC